MADDNSPPTDPAAAPRFDQLLGELRSIVDRLESGSLGLEEALRAFEAGVHLARQGATLLDAAEERVEVLLRDPSRPGGVRTAPLDVPPAT